MRTTIALRLLPLALLLVIPAATMPALASSPHEAGIKAFEKGDYEEALRYFRQAQRKGVNTPNLCYNLGVTYYRLERYNRAAEAFRLLKGNPDWRPLALYNLGLVAEAQGDSRKAKDYYSRVREVAGESRVARLAARKLQESGPAKSEPEKPEEPEKPREPEEIEETTLSDRTYGLISVAAGHDDNVVLAPEEGFEGISEEGDLFAEFSALAGAYVSGNREDGVRLDFDAFTRQYASETDYSFTSLSAGVSRLRAYERWDTSLGFSTAAELTDGGLYAVVPALELEGERHLGDFSLELANELSWIEGRGEYGYLTGIEDRLTARLERDIPGGRIYLGLGAEYNIREDLSENGEFYSYSPFRRDVHFGMDYLLAPRWTLLFHGQYRRSLYSDENRMEIDGEITETKREDDRLLISVRGEHEMSRDLVGFAEYTRTDNDSNLSRYSYTSNQVVLGVQMVF